MDRRAIGLGAVGIVLVITSLLGDSWFSDGLRYSAFAYISIDLVLRARSGYQRRRPFWNADSWRRYLLVCSVSLVALLTMLAMMVALENRWPIAGEARSGQRVVWALGTLAFMLIGTIGMVSAIEWLHRGEASGPFVLPEWLSRRRHEA
jgi:sterol desaturase/sphingolipid hydroxylase (fatty acid hydroxylase superfamily)